MIQFLEEGMWSRYRGWLEEKIKVQSANVELKNLSYFGTDILGQTEDRVIEDRVKSVARRRKWAIPTTYRLRTYLKKFFYWAYEWEKIKTGRTPYQRFFASKGPRPEPRYLIDEDIQRMIGNPFISVRDSLLVRLTYYSGARRSEIVALNVEDFEPETNTIHIRHGKRDKWGHVKIDSGTAALLKNYIEGFKAHGHANPGDPLFVVWGFKRMTGHHMWRTIKLNAKRVGKQCNPQALRHSIARNILKNGGTVAHVQHHLRHASPDTSLRYTHLLDDDVTGFLKK